MNRPHRTRPTAIWTIGAIGILLGSLVFAFHSPPPGAYSADYRPDAPQQTVMPPLVLDQYLPLVLHTEPPMPQPTATPLPDSAFALRMTARVNQYRQQHGCQPLVLNTKLNIAAQGHSEDMAFNDFLSHTGSDGSTADLRVTRAGYAWSLVAENLAIGYSTPETVVDAWFNESPPNDGHRRNLLNCSFQEMGAGYYYQADDQPNVCINGQCDNGPFYHYWTQVLARP